MTFEKLEKIIEVNDIPKDVILRSNSGWECCETEMDGVWYSKEENIIHFTQDGYSPNYVEIDRGFELIYGDDIATLMRKSKWSVAHGYCTLGGFDNVSEDEGLLELLNDAVNNGNPIGFLTAKDAFRIVIGKDDVEIDDENEV